LARSDYYFNVPDIKITDEKRTDILKYRQKLRDFPSKIVNGIYCTGVDILILTDDELLSYMPKL
jgi:hypothetical protein